MGGPKGENASTGLRRHLHLEISAEEVTIKEELNSSKTMKKKLIFSLLGTVLWTFPAIRREATGPDVVNSHGFGYKTGPKIQTNHEYSFDFFTAGYVNVTGAIDEISFKMSSGNMDGVIQLYGIA